MAPGSLNLAVEDAVIERLANVKPTLEESAAGIVYPSPYEYIPELRKAYWYYAATVRKDGRTESVLVRRAMVPVSGVVELFSAVSLRETFDLAVNDIISVEVHAGQRTGETGA